MKIFDSLLRKKVEFQPLKQEVGIYFCGPTVYGPVHLGNIRSLIFADCLVRTLRLRNDVNFVRNITDIDDKIIIAAKNNNETIYELTERTVKSFHDVCDKLNLARPTHEPRATDHVSEMIAFISSLIERGNAYVAKDHVFFKVGTYNVGNFVPSSNEEPPDGLKKDGRDFVLWKPSTDDMPGWDSPWGRGRPGWHIECSVMSEKYLGHHFDIHGGGADLKFPHHENEIAQSCCGGHRFANHWVHNGLLEVGGSKMSKSLGNFILFDECERRYDPEVLKFFFLSTHYSSTINFTWEGMEEAKAILDKFYRVLPESDETLPDEVKESLEDNLNIPKVITLMHEYHSKGDYSSMGAAGKFIGIFSKTSKEWFSAEITEEIERLLSLRKQARETKDWTKSDHYRNLLSDMGIIVRDTSSGQVWERK